MGGNDTRVLAHAGNPRLWSRAGAEVQHHAAVLGGQRRGALVRERGLLDDDQQGPLDPGRAGVLAGDAQAREGRGYALIADRERLAAHRERRR